MKSRILTAVVGLPILAVILFFNDTIVFNIAIALVCVLAVYEMLHATGYVHNPVLLLLSMAFAAFVPFSKMEACAPYFTLVLIVYLAGMLAVLFVKHSTVKFQELTVSFTAALLLPYGLSSLVFVRDLQPEIGLYPILMVFVFAWISDAGAYFIGLLFGRHKLAPTISPKKTIEGALGGVFFCILFTVAFTYVYADLVTKSGIQLTVHLGTMIVLSLLGSIVGILGDLSMSIIKRQTGIKDFGHLMPGHGGILDRFDSILFIAPFLYVAIQMFPIVTVI